MANIYKLDRKKPVDRRTALLGLAADQPTSAGVCPSPEEMAELMENKCQEEKKEKYFQHLAVCDTCYQEWLTLHQVLDKTTESTQESRILKILKPGNLAFFGTLLAAAASVVVFLNINFKMADRDLHTIPDESIQREWPSPQPEQHQPLSGIFSELEKKGEDKDIRKPSQAVIKPVTSAQKKEMPTMNDGGKIKNKTSASPAPAVVSPVPSLLKEEPQGRRSIPVESALPKTFGENKAQDAVRQEAESGAPKPLQKNRRSRAVAYENWHEQLEKGCRDMQESETFWREMEREGRQLKEKSQELKPEEAELLDHILRILSELEKNGTSERCRNILDLLEKERRVR